MIAQKQPLSAPALSQSQEWLRGSISAPKEVVGGLAAGSTVGDYVIVDEVGRGATGRVYQAVDLIRHRDVALKTISSPRGADFFRLKREFRATANLNHPNLVTPYELILDGPTAFFTMELITGRPFTTYIRAQPDPISALRVLWPALVGAVEALHAAGVLHLDLKPDNVLVEASGRVVVLDFGFAHSAAHASSGAYARSGMTPAYAAPERFIGAPPSHASDWYSVGLLLYEALTGRIPIADTLAELVAEKLYGSLPPPSQLVAGVPADLEAQCLALLHTEPALRVPKHSSSAPAVIGVGDSVVGGHELQVVEAATRRWLGGECVRLWITGPPGSGKSTLTQSLIGALPAGTLLLTSRCYSQEVVPYNVFDGIIDELASQLLLRSDSELSALVPASISVAAAAFPALRDLASRLGLQASPTAPRLDVLHAVRELFLLVARRVPLVVIAEDVHWGDLDSASLFLQLFSWSPAAPLLFVTTARTPALETDAFGQELRRRGVPRCLRGADYTVELSARAGRQDARRVAVTPLSERCGEVIELLAISERPLLQGILAVAARATDADFVALRDAGLVRYRRMHPDVAVELVDEQHGLLTLQSLSSARRVALHRTLAQTCSERPREDAAVARLWKSVGEHELAARHAERAAEAALARGAHSRAAELYTLALDWSGWSLGQQRELRHHRAEALVKSGQASAGAEAMAELALETRDDSLLRLAGEHYLAAGFHAQGLAILKPLLREAEVDVADSALGGVWGILRSVVASGFIGRGGASTSAAAVDLCWSATRGLIATDFINGAHVATQGLCKALALGDDWRSARAMSVVGAAILGPLGGVVGRWGLSWLARAHATATSLRDPVLLGTIEVLMGQLLLVRGEFRKALVRSVAGQRMLEPYNATFERNVGRMGALRAAEELGDFDYVRSRAFSYLNEARETGDRYGEATFALSAALAALASDDPACAEDVVVHALATWPVTQVYIQHLYLTRALTQRYLYDSDVERASRLLNDFWPGLERSQLLRVPVALIDAVSLRARVGLAMAEQGDQSGLATVAADIKRLERVSRSDARGWAHLLSGGLAAVNDELERAIHHYDQAVVAFEKNGMMGMILCAKLCRARLASDESNVTAVSQALDALGVARPDRWLHAYAPGTSRKAK